MKLIDLHKEWMRDCILPQGEGLCNAVPEKYSYCLEQFAPEGEERQEHRDDGYGLSYWGKHIETELREDVYNPFRQSVVLLICAMNNEL